MNLPLLVAALFTGCWGPPVSEKIHETIPSFTLPDVNPHSASFGQYVSTDGFQPDVTAWYFGHST